MRSFMAITVHTFSGCKANAFLLSFEAFKKSHTGSELLRSMRRLLVNSLVGEVDFYLTDNASNMGSAFDVMC